MDQFDRVRYLVNRYLNNACTRQEMDELLDYVLKYPEDEQLTNVLRESWDSEDSFSEAGGITWTEMQSRLRGMAVAASVHDRQGWLWKAAACILVLATFLAGFYFAHKNKVPTVAENQPSDRNSVQTANDERRLIVLSDGSKVWINRNSKLNSAPDFNYDEREVTLYGEAFFDIRHDPNKPFIILTGEVKTIVLGTALNIRAFRDENAVTVTVTRGKVRVEDENRKGGTITANQQITLDLQSRQLQAHAVNAEAVVKWIKGDLILHEVAFGDVEEMVEERYSVDIRFDNASLKECRFTSTFFQNASLDEVLTAICLVNGASYETNDKVITIYGKGCND